MREATRQEVMDCLDVTLAEETTDLDERELFDLVDEAVYLKPKEWGWETVVIVFKESSPAIFVFTKEAGQWRYSREVYQA